ncbi:hypothetical protein AHiyo6_25280 [Arthrobacter sp. Hiyo6]|nr:hypothetical protein AHiyo6_25280 [Arthrobacter sp. Hiyo6]
MDPNARISEFPNEAIALGFSNRTLKLLKVKSGSFTFRLGCASNGANTSHSTGTTKKARISAVNTVLPIRPVKWAIICRLSLLTTALEPLGPVMISSPSRDAGRRWR